MTDLEKLEEVLRDVRIYSLSWSQTIGKFVFKKNWTGLADIYSETIAEALKSVREELKLEDKDE